MCMRLCVYVCAGVLVLVCNYRFVIEYVVNPANEEVKCMAVSFDMIKVLCAYNYRVMTARRD